MNTNPLSGTSSKYYPRIAIVGGGLSGTMTAFHLLNLSPMASITIFEQAHEQMGRGNAYAPSSAHHLLNVPVEAMGATASDPGEFLRWLTAHGHEIPEKSFVSRRWYGEYLNEILSNLQAGAKDRLQTIVEELIAVQRLDSGELEIRTVSGRTQIVDHLIIATGTTPRTIPIEGASSSSAARVIMSPWRQSVFENVSPNDSIAIIGSSLSAVDVLVEAVKLKFPGSFFVISPTGSFPCAHAQNLSPIAALTNTPPWTTVLEALRGIRALTAQYSEWQHSIDAVRPHLNKIWNRMHAKEKRRFFRHAASIWDRHRHRVPQSAETAINELRKTGKLTLHAGKVAKVVIGSKYATVHINARGSGTTQQINANMVVNCSGFALDIQRFPSALAKNILVNQLGHPGELGLGWCCDQEGALCTPKGDRIPGMWAMGALRRSSEFECTAAREVRMQAENLAHSILKDAFLQTPVALNT